MLTINQILMFAYDLSKKRTFSNPKTYTANGDLDKR